DFTAPETFLQLPMFDRRKTIKLVAFRYGTESHQASAKETNNMDLQIQGKRALVTGSSAGIGEAIAKTLAQEGAFVVVHGRRETEVFRVVQEIETAGGKAFAAIGDLGTDVGATQVAQATLKAIGGVD